MADTLDVSTWKRNPKEVVKSLKIVGDQTIATDEIRIIFPERFTSKGLCSLDKITNLISYYCIADKNDNYAITNDPVFQTFQPDKISMINIKDLPDSNKSYIMLKFNKDSTVIVNNQLVQDTSIMFNILDEFYNNGKIPWYMNYEDIANIFLNSKKYAGSNVGNDPVGFELLSSLISKDKTGLRPYKDILTKREDIFTQKVVYTKLADVQSFRDTASKLIGNYFKDGLASALVENEETSSDISKLLRT
jgi:hypothetical protein|nr:MAG TPA: hypothetical protein [Caudoviricetes sp.]